MAKTANEFVKQQLGELMVEIAVLNARLSEQAEEIEKLKALAENK